ncbi:M20/M25/M40 family metallo-hydrolase [Calycomorphotria hydatis]|uniref:Bacterial leucyl aminopeptidase n=1 Tax=Calycomorphotria hydatis TaxID=2528027 RepID=A0A517T790_9PLAN|nr:M20/M25/M40 family metallo-hydrolase [Calycomorphotria hydatis]QDT64237.1 Bacterial leucyl aminopeptidase precursor [Calycomorphotria hydatis]
MQIRISFLFAFAVAVTLTGADSLAVAWDYSSATSSITANELSNHVNTLASDAFEGREAGRRGGRAARAYLVSELKKLGIQPAGVDGQYEQSFGSDYANLLAMIPGGKLSDEFILLCAHYDHVGFGSRNNSYGPFGRVHNGADDNASGTAAVLEVVEALAKLQPPPSRSILIAFWDAEEKGLLGSEHWASRPTIPLEKVKFALNLDMVGRLRENDLEVYGIRTATGLRKLVSQQNTSGIKLDFNWTNEKDSDHYTFYRRGIPYLMYHTRKHGEYHRPSDDTHLLNIDGIQQISQMTLGTVLALAEVEDLSFRQSSKQETNGTKNRLMSSLRRNSRKPKLGVKWDQRKAAEGDIIVQSVRVDSLAANVGLRTGDHLLQLGETEITGPDQFYQLVQQAAGTVPLKFARRGKTENVSLNFPSRSNLPGIEFRTNDAEPGVLIVDSIESGSTIGKVGLQQNDRLVSADRKAVSIDTLANRLQNQAAPIDVVYERDGVLREVTILPAEQE